MDKEVRKLVQSIQDIPGVEISGNGGKNHLIFKYRDKFVTTLPSTPSDSRWRDNTVATLRRHCITPGTKPRGNGPQVRELMPLEEVRRRLVAMLAERGATSGFARYLVEEVAPNANLRSYASVESASASLKQIREGGEAADWTHALIDQGLRWQDKLRSAAGNGGESLAAQRIAEQHDLLDEIEFSNRTLEPGFCVSVDLGVLNGFLATFGIEVRAL